MNRKVNTVHLNVIAVILHADHNVWVKVEKSLQPVCVSVCLYVCLSVY